MGFSGGLGLTSALLLPRYSLDQQSHISQGSRQSPPGKSQGPGRASRIMSGFLHLFIPGGSSKGRGVQGKGSLF